MYIADYHTHSKFSSDGKDTVAALCETAVRAGLDELCITDHFDCYGQFDPLAREAEIQAAQQAFAGKLVVKCGVELGESTHMLPQTEALLSQGSFDFVMGSYHILRGGEDFYLINYSSEADCYAYLERYLAELFELVSWGRFHVLGHLTYPLRYMVGREGYPVSLAPYEERVGALYRELVNKNIGLEVNVSGFRKPGGFAMPDLPLLKLYRACGGEIVTVGSDAHLARDVGRGIAEGQELLKAAGFSYFAAYADGIPAMKKL